MKILHMLSDFNMRLDILSNDNAVARAALFSRYLVRNSKWFGTRPTREKCKGIYESGLKDSYSMERL